MRQPPEDPGDEKIEIGEPSKHAAGVPAVLSALRHGVREMGPVRTARTLVHINQERGFDCMGCAWPDPGKRHHAEFCENGAKAVAEEATRFRADRDFFAQWSVEDIARNSDFWIGKRGRLTEPMYLAPGATHYAPISWDDAYGLIADELAALDSPDEATFYTSGRTSNEAAFAYQAFVRAFGTNNLPDCSNMCHESSGSALNRTVGIGKGSVTLEDIEQADLLVIVGQNPGTNHPRMLSSLETAKQAGAKIVSINPLREAGLSRFDNPQTVKGMLGRGTKLADLHLPIRINGDMALFGAVNRRLLERDAIDHAFIANHCGGFNELRAHLLRGDEPDVTAATGLSIEDVEAFTQLVVDSKRTIVCWAMGLTQHRNSVATIQEIVNTILLRGMIGKPGAGLCPVRGHSNVQGDRTMGIWEKPTEAFLDRMETALGFPQPREHGHDVVESIQAMLTGEIKVFIAMGGNFLSAAPDTNATAEALQRCRLTVHVATKPNRSHVTTGHHALLLPTLGRTEKDFRNGNEQRVSVEDSMSAVHASRGRLAPASKHLRSEVAIVCDLAERVLGDRVPVPWRDWSNDYGLIRNAIEAAIPGFDDFDARLSDGFVLPSPPRDEVRFTTPSGRAELTVNHFVPVAVPEGRLLLQTLRSHDQYNTTIYGLNDRYRGIKSGRRVVLLHPDDIRAFGVVEGAIVDLISEDSRGVERRSDRYRVVEYDTPRGCAAAYYPETNALVPLDSVAEESGTPTSKSVVIRIEPSA
ncbi:FdhF/YdeP family oxidoreductase [Solirubrobacter phytolaccae]|uniref:FdhF/YdeP family oxidoreductase n=2 Tax=Solirubrobacter phytolaccae TaxID=1404360 RepID=A0A9X3NCN0_9ACTN|nr:FdhF/YdeP family oxidoreductase [Solirubrobacter phytolaccae]MDA0184013.1 FdhF/YdeP family oxidoreductase [Solirubrobacter phytolaccae]